MTFEFPEYWSEMSDHDKFLYISEKITSFPESADGYAMLGEFYYNDRPNLAYLSYEQAAFYCERYGKDPEELQYLEGRLRELRSMESVTVRPASFIILSMNTLEFTRNCLDSIRAGWK